MELSDIPASTRLNLGSICLPLKKNFKGTSFSLALILNKERTNSNVSVDIVLILILSSKFFLSKNMVIIETSPLFDIFI